MGWYEMMQDAPYTCKKCKKKIYSYMMHNCDDKKERENENEIEDLKIFDNVRK